MIITIECSSIANYSSFDMEMTSSSPLNNGKISTDFLGFKLSYHGKKQLRLSGWSWRTTLWGSVPKVCLFSQHVYHSFKVNLNHFPNTLANICSWLWDFETTFFYTLFPTKVRSGPARVVANIETAGNSYIEYISKLNYIF